MKLKLKKNEILTLDKNINYINEKPIVKPDSCLVKTKSNQTFNDFCIYIMETYNVKDLNIFYRNMSNLKIIYMKDFNKYNKDKCCEKMGHYIINKNKIEVLKNVKKGVLIHELHHSMSSYYSSKAVYSGFHQFNIQNNIDIGVGLNEGYTEYLTEQYCQKNSIPNIKNIYTIPKKYAMIIESIIGQNKMVEFYLTGDLKGLINELSSYESAENTITFLLDLDKLHKDFLTQKATREMLVKDLTKCNNYIDKITNNYKKANIIENRQCILK